MFIQPFHNFTKVASSPLPASCTKRSRRYFIPLYSTIQAKHSNFSDMEQAAKLRNEKLVNNSLGPVVQLMLIENESGTELASISGAFLPPDNRLHIESYRSLTTTISKSLLTVSPSMFVFISALSLAADKQSKHVYGLAINDNIEQHKKLLRYLKRFGGNKLRVVDDSLRSLPDRIFYGGFGTIIKGEVSNMFQRGYSMIKRQQNTN